MSDSVVVEIESVGGIVSVYESQLLTYLRPGGWRLGLLISFNDAVFKDGIRRKIMGYDSAL